MDCPDISTVPWWQYLLLVLAVLSLAAHGIYLLVKRQEGSFWRTIIRFASALALIYFVGTLATGAYGAWLWVFLVLAVVVPLAVWRLMPNLRQRAKAGLKAARANPSP